MQNILFIIHSSPYGDEHFFSALRLALQLQEQHKSAVNLKVFLMSDAVTGGLAKQNPAEGYHLQQMLEILTSQGATIKLCKTCTNASSNDVESCLWTRSLSSTTTKSSASSFRSI